jgi:translation initiation factor IF-2
MSNAKNELFLYMAAALATLVGLFVLHRAYAAVVDVSYHKRLAEAGQSEAVTAARQADEAALQKGKIPLDQAIARIGKGRANVGSVAPQPSQDLSAISGWIYHPKFKPAVAHPIRLPRAPAAQPPKATEPPAASSAPSPAPAAAAPSAAAVAAPATPDPAVTQKKPAPAPAAVPQPAPAQ